MITGAGILVGCTRSTPTEPRPSTPSSIRLEHQCNAENLLNQPVREYTFIHHETTGITSHVILENVALEDSSQAIVFHPKSNARALRLLHALSVDIFLESSYESRIAVVGRLATVQCIQPFTKTPGETQTEAYREFILERWFLRAPFLEEELLGPDRLDEMAKVRARTHLEAKDFPLPTTPEERATLVRPDGRSAAEVLRQREQKHKRIEENAGKG